MVTVVVACCDLQSDVTEEPRCVFVCATLRSATVTTLTSSVFTPLSENVTGLHRAVGPINLSVNASIHQQLLAKNVD